MSSFAIAGLIASVLAVVLFVVVLIVMINLRRVVPTNMVHIVQSSKETTPYGRGKPAGNTYYSWPSWVPKIGVSVIAFPESIFPINLSNYDAYDDKRLPFLVDIAAFFRVDDANTVAQRVASFGELNSQLQNVLQGAVRRILAQNTLADIMGARATLAEAFTREVADQIKEWGVSTVKSIEFMDIRDTKNSEVINDIMAKEKSAIERESRKVVAENNQQAEEAEINARREVDLRRQEAEQMVGIREATKTKEVGTANEEARQAIQIQAKITAENTLAVQAVEDERSATIKKNVLTIDAEAALAASNLNADANLYTAQRSAEAVKVEGDANAAAEQAMLMAPVHAQLELAKGISADQGYQEYLVTIRQIEAQQTVGYAMAKALEESDLKIISTGGSNESISSGVAGLASMFTPAGGTNLAGMIEGFKATPEGAALIKKLTGSKAVTPVKDTIGTDPV